MSLESYDLIMLGILAAAALLGYFKGMVWQIAWIAGICASSYVALRFGAQVAPFTRQPAPWDRLLAMLGLYVTTSLVVWILFRLISSAINAVHLSAFDHQLGLLLGLAKGSLLCIVITFFAVTMAPAYREQIVASHSGRLVAELIVRADTYLPKEIHDTVDPFVRQFEENFDRTGRNGAAAAATTAQSPPQPASPWQAVLEGVSSAAAWTGGPTDGKGAGSGAAPVAWFMPQGSGPETPEVGRAAPSRFTSSPPEPFPGPSPSAVPFAAPLPAQSAAPPQMFPLGAQTPLPPR